MTLYYLTIAIHIHIFMAWPYWYALPPRQEATYQSVAACLEVVKRENSDRGWIFHGAVNRSWSACANSSDEVYQILQIQISRAGSAIGAVYGDDSDYPPALDVLP